MAWIASLWSSSSFWEGVEYVAEATVIIGALVELLANFEHILKGNDKKELRKGVEKRAAIGLIVGLAIGLGALVRTNHLFANTITSLYSEARDAGIKATKSNERAEAAFKQAISAWGQADKANKDLEVERQKTARFQREATEAQRSLAIDLAKQQTLTARAQAEAAKANLEFARLKTPRTLSPQQQARLVAGLVRFAGTPFDLVVYSDSESFDLMETIQSVLLSAKWKQVPIKGVVGIGGSVPLIGIGIGSGILVEIGVSSKNWYGAVEYLVNLLRAEGIDARGEAVTTGANPDAIDIHIGKKP